MAKKTSRLTTIAISLAVIIAVYFLIIFYLDSLRPRAQTNNANDTNDTNSGDQPPVWKTWPSIFQSKMSECLNSGNSEDKCMCIWGAMKTKWTEASAKICKDGVFIKSTATHISDKYGYSKNIMYACTGFMSDLDNLRHFCPTNTNHTYDIIWSYNGIRPLPGTPSASDPWNSGNL